MIGYFGDDAGDPVGRARRKHRLLLEQVFHRSGPNTTDHARRVYVAQYSHGPVLDEYRLRPRHLAVPLNRH